MIGGREDTWVNERERQREREREGISGGIKPARWTPPSSPHNDILWYTADR